MNEGNFDYQAKSYEHQSKYLNIYNNLLEYIIYYWLEFFREFTLEQEKHYYVLGNTVYKLLTNMFHTDYVLYTMGPQVFCFVL